MAWPVSMLSTVVSGWRLRQSAHEACSMGGNFGDAVLMSGGEIMGGGMQVLELLRVTAATGTVQRMESHDQVQAQGEIPVRRAGNKFGDLFAFYRHTEYFPSIQSFMSGRNYQCMFVGPMAPDITL
jgi:hypothetical protein